MPAKQSPEEAAQSTPEGLAKPRSRSESAGPLRVGSSAPAMYIVLVGLDLSEPGGRAWRVAFDLAAAHGDAEVHAVVLGARGLTPRLRDVSTPGASSSAL